MAESRKPVEYGPASFKVPSGEIPRKQLIDAINMYEGSPLGFRARTLSFFLKKVKHARGNIAVFDDKYKFIHHLLERIKRLNQSRPGSGVVVALGGVRGAGKSTVFDKLYSVLNRAGLNVERVKLDFYGKNKMRAPGKLDNPFNIEWKEVKRAISSFKKREPLELRESKSASRQIDSARVDVLVVEGLHALLPWPFTKKVDLRAMLYSPPGIQNLSTVFRDLDEDAEASKQDRAKIRSLEYRVGFNSRIKQFERQLLLPTVKYADAVYFRNLDAGDLHKLTHNLAPQTLEYFKQLARKQGIAITIPRGS